MQKVPVVEAVDGWSAGVVVEVVVADDTAVVETVVIVAETGVDDKLWYW